MSVVPTLRTPPLTEAIVMARAGLEVKILTTAVPEIVPIAPFAVWVAQLASVMLITPLE